MNRNDLLLEDGEFILNFGFVYIVELSVLLSMPLKLREDSPHFYVHMFLLMGA